MKKTSQRSLLFRQNVGRTEEEWAHFLDGYRQALSLRLASTSGRGGRGVDEGQARTRGGYLHKTRRNRGKNEVRLGAWHLGFLTRACVAPLPHCHSGAFFEKRLCRVGIWKAASRRYLVDVSR